jgi:hypothetical protein
LLRDACDAAGLKLPLARSVDRTDCEGSMLRPQLPEDLFTAPAGIKSRNGAITGHCLQEGATSQVVKVLDAQHAC